ncbi:MAG: hypothetical protein IT517_06510 [Burkholderiales bacterium]|nr:hypothetical protein [Burkholderiales bacterium]
MVAGPVPADAPAAGARRPVTQLFTDLEGSTRLWERAPEAMRGALAAHDALARRVVATHGGAVVKTVGDGLHAVFAGAAAAPAGPRGRPLARIRLGRREPRERRWRLARTPCTRRTRVRGNNELRHASAACLPETNFFSVAAKGPAPSVPIPAPPGGGRRRRREWPRLDTRGGAPAAG